MLRIWACMPETVVWERMLLVILKLVQLHEMASRMRVSVDGAHRRKYDYQYRGSPAGS